MSNIIEEDDDDLYDPSDSVPAQQQGQNSGTAGEAKMDTGSQEEEEIEVEEEEDEDDFNIITEAAPDAVAEPATQHPRHGGFRNEPPRQTPSEPTPAIPTPLSAPKAEAPTPQTTAARPAVPQKPGSSYPAQHTSTIDVAANPVHPSTNKPILNTDLDTDFPSEDEKPWRRPGSDISDYFNYGFDEFTWASYCLKQRDLRKEVGDQRKQMEDMQAFLGMGAGGMPGMPGPPPPQVGPGGVPGTGGGTPGPSQGAGPQSGMSGMPPGMPDLSPDMMQGMLSTMMAQGLDPSSMDPMAFMQHAQAMMGGGQQGAAPPQAAQQGFGAQGPGQGFGGQPGGQQQMGYGGYDQRGSFGPGGRGRGGRRW